MNKEEKNQGAQGKSRELTLDQLRSIVGGQANTSVGTGEHDTTGFFWDELVDMFRTRKSPEGSGGW